MRVPPGAWWPTSAATLPPLPTALSAHEREQRSRGGHLTPGRECWSRSDHGAEPAWCSARRRLSWYWFSPAGTAREGMKATLLVTDSVAAELVLPQVVWVMENHCPASVRPGPPVLQPSRGPRSRPRVRPGGAAGSDGRRARPCLCRAFPGSSPERPPQLLFS